MSALSDGIVLRTDNLTKRYGDLVAVSRLNIELRLGEVLGLLGPNGSGKSTTVGMILGLIRPTAGSIELFGQPLREHRWEALRRIGAIIESPSFHPYLTGHDNLAVLARAIGAIPESRIEETLRRVDLLDRAGGRYENYSLGMKQRLGIASTLLRDPELIILDEPTNGLDPAGTREVRELIPSLAAEGRAVLLCSHLLHEVEQVCDRVAILRNGDVVAEGPVGELLGASRALRIRLDGEGRREEAVAALRALPWVDDVRWDDPYLIVSSPVERAAEINRELAARGVYLAELTPIRGTLEDIFIEVTER